MDQIENSAIHSQMCFFLLYCPSYDKAFAILAYTYSEFVLDRLNIKQNAKIPMHIS